MKSKTFLRRPVFMNMWENHPIIWKSLINVGILMKYKTLNIDKLPKYVTFPSSTRIYVDSNENRGKALLLNEGITQNRLRSFWDKVVQNYAPDLVIDVGVNYGECIFSTIYPDDCVIYGIEANHYLLNYILQSKAVHPHKERMTIIHALASNTDNCARDFYIDRHWSGTSSASYVPSHQMIEKVPVNEIAIDSLFQNENYHTLLFKVDVEGYEAFVIAGMKKLLANCSSAIGFIEFNSEYIMKSGIEPKDFYSFLQKHFSMYVYLEDDTLMQADGVDYSKLLDKFGSVKVHTDFILWRGEANFQP